MFRLLRRGCKGDQCCDCEDFNFLRSQSPRLFGFSREVHTSTKSLMSSAIAFRFVWQITLNPFVCRSSEFTRCSNVMHAFAGSSSSSWLLHSAVAVKQVGKTVPLIRQPHTHLLRSLMLQLHLLTLLLCYSVYTDLICPPPPPRSHYHTSEGIGALCIMYIPHLCDMYPLSFFCTFLLVWNLLPENCIHRLDSLRERH